MNVRRWLLSLHWIMTALYTDNQSDRDSVIGLSHTLSKFTIEDPSLSSASPTHQTVNTTSIAQKLLWHRRNSRNS